MHSLFRTGLLLLTLLSVEHVSAHATPVLYEPPASAVLNNAPTKLHIHFSERIDPAASSVHIFNPNGSAVDTTKSMTNPEDAREFLIPLTVTATGTYTVSWQVVSADDGHFTKGGYLFSIGQESGVPGTEPAQFEVVHRSGWPEAIVISLELLGNAILLGCIAFLFLWRREEEKIQLRKRLLILVVTAAVLISVGAIGYLWIENINLAADQGISVIAAMQMFLKTVAGTYTVYRLGLGMVIAVILGMNLRSLLQSSIRTKTEYFLWILVIALALLRARVSHAAASSFLPDFSIFVNALHLLSKDLWIGGLVVFFVACRKPTMRALLTFSNVLMLSFAIGGVTGTYIVWLHLKSPLNLLTTHWGGYLVALGSYAFVLLTLRLYQQQVTHKSMLATAEGSATKTEQEEAGMLGMVFFSEMLTGLAVLLFSSLLLNTTPPLTKHLNYLQKVVTSNAIITLEDDSEESDNFLVTVHRTNTARTATGDTMTIALENTDKNIGPIIAPTENRFPGGYVFPKNILSPGGNWTLHITDQLPRTFDAVARMTITYPDDVAAVNAANNAHTVGLFEEILSAVALSIVIAAFLLYRKNRALEKQWLALAHPLQIPSLQIRFLPFMLILDLSILIVIGMTLGNHNHGDKTFLQECNASGGLWHEELPIQNGKVTGKIEALGCTIGSGAHLFHFTDPRTYHQFNNQSVVTPSAK